MCQHEGIPPALRGHPDWVLSLCAEHGIDEENHAEAREFLEYWTQTLLGSDYSQESEYRYSPILQTHELWLEAHAAYDPNVSEEENNSKPEIANYRKLIETTYGVTLTKRDNVESSWDLLRVRMVHVDLAMAAAAIGNMARSHGLNWDDATAFWRIIGNIKLELSGETRSGAKASVYGRTITFYRRPNGTENFLPLMDLFQHELGHVFNAIAGMGDRDGAGSINLTFGHPDTLDGMGSPMKS